MFNLGTICLTRGVADLVSENAEFANFILRCLARHAGGDWGDLDEEDKQANQEALQRKERLLSAYNDDRFPKHGVATVWIITEADRQYTTILFPDEY